MEGSFQPYKNPCVGCCKDIHGGYMIFYRNPYRQVTGVIILVSVFIAGAPEICYADV